MERVRSKCLKSEAESYVMIMLCCIWIWCTYSVLKILKTTRFAVRFQTHDHMKCCDFLRVRKVLMTRNERGWYRPPCVHWTSPLLCVHWMSPLPCVHWMSPLSCVHWMRPLSSLVGNFCYVISVTTGYRFTPARMLVSKGIFAARSLTFYWVLHPQDAC